jgi:hypothetical protein
MWINRPFKHPVRRSHQRAYWICSTARLDPILHFILYNHKELECHPNYIQWSKTNIDSWIGWSSNSWCLPRTQLLQWFRWKNRACTRGSFIQEMVNYSSDLKSAPPDIGQRLDLPKSCSDILTHPYKIDYTKQSWMGSQHDQYRFQFFSRHFHI